MSTDVFAKGTRAKGICDICGFTSLLSRLKALTINETKTQLMACPACWNEDHPQYLVGKIQVVDAEALRNPRPDQPDRTITRGPNDDVFGVVE